MRNIELKARLRDLATARRTAAALATAGPMLQEQVDTYFHCRAGRLKLREIGGRPAELIWYARPDTQAAKASDYTLVPVPEPAALKAVLDAALGVRGVVQKRREIFLHENVRIHLDEVAGLGTFLEFEAVLGPEVDDARGQAQLADLGARFGLTPADLLSNSYGDMVGGQDTPSGEMVPTWG
jgi:predicted adenylyl cyclase CyaB